MLGKSLRGDYVFSSEGDLIKAGQTTSFYKVSLPGHEHLVTVLWVYVRVLLQLTVCTCHLRAHLDTEGPQPALTWHCVCSCLLADKG
jgi:hypothetical protein